MNQVYSLSLASTPDRMHLIDIAAYCKRKGMSCTTDWAIDLIDSADTIDRYYIDTQVIRDMFTLGGTDLALWHALECEVATFIGMTL
jgi:hypothetical protein